MNYRKHVIVISGILLCVGLLSMSFMDKTRQPSRAVGLVGSWYKAEIHRFDSLLEKYPIFFYDSSYSKRVEKFEELTRQIKRIEGLFIYFHPTLAYETFFLSPVFEKRDFGPPFPDNWLFTGPFGIEPDSALQKSSKADSVLTRKFIERTVRSFRKIIAEINVEKDIARMTDADLFEALRLQMIRISTTGIGNADFVVEQTAMAALQGEFEGWATMMNLLLESLPGTMENYKSGIRQKLTAGGALLFGRPGYANFNRLDFLTDYLVPLANDLFDLQKALNVPAKTSFSALNSSAKNIFEANVFNINFFASDSDAFSNEARIELGKLLFFDPILSDNNERACASCHKPELAFTDGNIKSEAFDRGELSRNSPTVINAVFQKKQFWDLRAGSLEDQLDSVVNNRDELHSSFENVISKINAGQEYRQLFYDAFPDSRKTGIERKHVKIAIACYERELTGLNSRFDQYMRGDKTRMNQAEINGFNLFVGKAKCGTCHYTPVFNGALPPYFEITDHRSLGVPVKDTMDIYEVDGDVGVFKSTGNPFFNFSFKVPTVRNVALTAPYMHNGVYKTLLQVVDFYNDGAGNNFSTQMRPGMKGLPFFMILPEKLNLTNQEKNELVSFMNALTDTSCTKNIPDRLPVLTGKYARLNNRVVGGVY